MGWIFVPLILITSVLMLTGYLVALGKHRDNDINRRDDWLTIIMLAVVTLILLLIYAGLSSSVLVSDALVVMWLIISLAMFISIIFGRSYYKRHNEKGKFKKFTWSTFGIGVVFFLLIGMTGSGEAEEAAASNTVADEETVEETEKSTEEPTEETTTEAEKEAAEKKAEEEAEKKKEESIETAEKKKEESIEAEKEKETSIEEKQKKEESIEAEKEKEESIEAEKEESIEKEEQQEEETEEESTEEEPEEGSAAPKDGLIPVDLYRVVDGDTVNVIDNNGEELDLRLLLIDTPETVHPNKPVEPHGKEASARLTELLNNADQLYIEYDSGEKTDHYDRHLVYLYADNVSVHETLLEEGLARVGYIYEQQKYLSDFREAEQHAKDNQLGIWSIPGYVNEGGEGFNSEESEPEPTDEPETSEPETTEESTQSESFEDCDDLRGTHPTGVPKGHAAYQSKMDRDKDDYACEVS